MAARDKEELSCVLRVDKLSRNINNEHLYDIFQQYGDLQKAEVQIDPKVKLSLGYGFLQYKCRADAEKAFIQMNNGQIDGKHISLKFKELTIDQKLRHPLFLYFYPCTDI